MAQLSLNPHITCMISEAANANDTGSGHTTLVDCTIPVVGTLLHPGLLLLF